MAKIQLIRELNIGRGCSFRVVRVYSGVATSTIHLVLDFYDWDLRPLQVPLISELRPHELQLNVGRFERFTTKWFDHSVPMYENWCQRFEEFIEWIQKSTQGRWSVDIKHSHQPVVFLFEEPNDAILFKLTFGGTT